MCSEKAKKSNQIRSGSGSGRERKQNMKSFARTISYYINVVRARSTFDNFSEREQLIHSEKGKTKNFESKRENSDSEGREFAMILNFFEIFML